MVPLSLWQPGDRIVDVRYLALPPGEGPFRALVGIYDAVGRFPAYTDEGRCPDDAAPVATIGS
jgi:hypothetical protein